MSDKHTPQEWGHEFCDAASADEQNHSDTVARCAHIVEGLAASIRAEVLQEICDAMMARGLATGHGDSVDELVGEIVAQAAEIERRQWESSINKSPEETKR